MLILIQVLLLYGMLSNGKNHAEIGDYSNVNMKSCGLTAIILKENQISGRIVNGMDARLGEFPWMVSIVVNGTHICSGVIINELWVLSAAFGFTIEKVLPKEFSLFVGSLNYKSGVEYKAKNIYPHHRYDVDDHGFTNDIALIELTSQITPIVNSTLYTVNGICLPKKDIMNKEAEEARFSGWGVVDANGTDWPQNLKKAQYIINPHNQCRKKFICNKVENIACFGDEGSPLIQFVDNKAVVIGIYSHNEGDIDVKLCNKNRQLFIRVSQYIDWILSIIKNKSDHSDGQEGSNKDQVNSIILICLIYFVLFFAAIIVLSIVLFVIHKNNSSKVKRLDSSTSRSSSSQSLLKTSQSNTSFNDASIQTVNSKTGLPVH